MSERKYAALVTPASWLSQYSLRTEFPIFILSSQSRFQVSNLVDLTLVVDGPSALCAPEQFIQMKTPKSKEAPE